MGAAHRCAGTIASGWPLGASLRRLTTPLGADGSEGGRVKGLGLALLAGLLMSWPLSALALDPAFDVGQYGHTAWRIRDGFSKGFATAMAQTSDGYLWLGTGAGLTRFDGVRNTPWRPPAGQSLPDARIRILLATRDGALWIGAGQGLARWDGRQLVSYPRFAREMISGLAEDRDGTVWVTSAFSPAQRASICAIRGAKVQCQPNDKPIGAWAGLYKATDGALWVFASSGLWHWAPGPPKLLPQAGEVTADYQVVAETATGAVVFATPKGLRQINGDKVEPFAPLPAATPRPLLLLRDRDGGLWIALEDEGLIHVHQGRVDAFKSADGLSGDQITAMLEDREGNIWVATHAGLDRFRALPAAIYGAAQGRRGTVGAVLADRDGSLWMGATTGLARWRDGRVFTYRGRPEPALASAIPGRDAAAHAQEVVVPGLPDSALVSLFEDSRGRLWFGGDPRTPFGYLQNGRFVAVPAVPPGFVDAIIEDSSGGILVAHRDKGLLRLSPDLSVQPLRWTANPRHGDGWRLARDPTGDGLWLGHHAGGVVHLVGGQVRESHSAADGLGRGAVNDVRVAADGTVWAATDGGLSRIRNGRVTTLTSRNGLPCDAVHATVEDDRGAIWAYTACGLVAFSRADFEAWAAAAKPNDPPRTMRLTVLDDTDGVSSLAPSATTPSPHLAKARDGKLWFISGDGVTMVDPRRLVANRLPPPVQVERLVADRKTYDASSPIHLPPLVRDLQIDYTALSFVAPEKVRFRYRLEGRDHAWQDAGNRRQAFYTDLAPGNYRFRVIAANNSGVWNNEGASLAFSIAPAYWQTKWFLALVVGVAILLLWAAYQVRMRQLARAAARERAVEERQRALQTELAHANRLATMGQLAASIAHEIRQPIGGVLVSVGAAQRWLARGELAEVQRTHEQIQSGAARANDIIDGLRGLSQKQPARAERFDISAAVREVLLLTHGEATKHGVLVESRLAAGLPTAVGDIVQIQQVILNLVVNAVEAMGGVGEGPRDLLVSTARAGTDFVEVRVEDTGPGLAAEAAAHAFEAFFTTKPEGLGMGLSICRSIVEAHGGTLTMTPNTPRGAIVRFTVPAAAVVREDS